MLRKYRLRVSGIVPVEHGEVFAMRQGSGGIIPVILLCAALASGVSVFLERLTVIREWRAASAFQREEMRYETAWPVIVRTQRAIPENGSILLMARLDPALLPYYLFPRRIYQCGVDPETNAVYMDLPPSPYPQRSPESFNVDAILTWNEDNWQWGGELHPAERRP